jgi:membrane protease subunit HflK
MRRLLTILAIVALSYLATGVSQVRPGERAVVRRFGKVVAQPGPGLWISLPWGIDRVDRVPVNFVRRVTIGFQPETDSDTEMPSGQLLTGDQNLVNVQAAIDYAIGDGDDVVRYVLNRDRVEDVILRAGEAALTEWVAGQSVDTVLLTGPVALRQWLPLRIEERLARYELGVEVRVASITFMAPPDEVKAAFDQVNIAQTGIRTKEHEARQHAEGRLRATQAEQTELERQADAYAQGKSALAKAEAEVFLTRLAQLQRLRKDNPDILTAIWWSEMGKRLVQLRTNGRIDLLDDHLGADGLDITQFTRTKKKNP